MFHRTLRNPWLLLLAALPSVGRCASAEDFEFFEKKIRPILVENCYKCHSAQSEKVKGGFLLDTREGVLKGGETGPAIVPGDPEKSLLIKAVRYTDKDLQMPPKDKKLPDAQIADLAAWVKMGAPDPRVTEVRAAGTAAAKAKTWWAFQPLLLPKVPGARDKNPIDSFIDEKLAAVGVAKAGRADRRSLLRRATFDLTGLPPTPDEIAAFLEDDSPGAFSRILDRVLASPAYGERWGRPWVQ